MYARFSSWIGDKPWFRRVARVVVPRVDDLLGRLGLRITPWPTLILITTRMSGDDHRSPLYFVDTANGPAVIASNFGGEEPAWSRHLRRRPRCRVTHKRSTTAHQARLASQDEWRDLFERFADFYPSYRAYLKRADRHIPIWVLEREA